MENKTIKGKVTDVDEIKEIRDDFFVSRIELDNKFKYGVSGTKDEVDRFIKDLVGESVSFSAVKKGNFWNVQDLDKVNYLGSETITDDVKVSDTKKLQLPVWVNKQTKDEAVILYSELLNDCIIKVELLTESHPKFKGREQELVSTLFIALERKLYSRERGY